MSKLGLPRSARSVWNKGFRIEQVGECSGRVKGGREDRLRVVDLVQFSEQYLRMCVDVMARVPVVITFVPYSEVSVDVEQGENP